MSDELHSIARKQFPVILRQILISGVIGPLLQATDDFHQGVAIISRRAESVDHPLEAQMKWDCRHIDGIVFGDIGWRRRDRV